jgi:hypothetical protein
MLRTAPRRLLRSTARDWMGDGAARTRRLVERARSSGVVPSWLHYDDVCVAAAALAAVFGWWYWLEASYRKLDRSCDAAHALATEKFKALRADVEALERRWEQDVQRKDEAMQKVQEENYELARSLDVVTAMLRQCNALR